MSIFYAAYGLAAGLPLLGFLYWKNLDNKTYKKIKNVETGELVPKSPSALFRIAVQERLRYQECREKYGNIIFNYTGGIPTLLVSDPDVIKDVLYMKQYKFEKGTLTNVLEPFFGLHNLPVVEGEDWKHQRKVMAPAFRNTTIQQLLPKIQEVCDLIVKKYLEICKDAPATINIIEVVTKYTIDVITAVAFNEISATDEINKIFLAGVKATIKKAPLLILPGLRSLPKWMKGLGSIEYCKDVFTKWINKVIESVNIKQPNEQSKLSLINLLLTSKDEETGAGLSYEEIADNIKMFYFAGHETTATLLTYVFFYLIKYPEMFKKIQDEINIVIGSNKEITLEHIEKLVYLQSFIKETLRLKTPVPILNRMATEETQAGKYIIPKGVRVLILIDALNRDKKYWDNADEFIPERWYNIDESKVKSEMHYMPFSVGPRICIGQRLAREEAIVFVISFARHFNIKSAEPIVADPIPDYKNITFKPKSLNVILAKKST
jgi:cytochrome P450